MKFSADKQTADDLNLLGKFKNKSIYSIFNRVKTKGGEKLLQDMFHNPLVDPEIINSRSILFEYFHKSGFTFQVEPALFSATEDYISSGGTGSRYKSLTQGIRRHLLHLFGLNEEYNQVVKGLESSTQILIYFKGAFSGLAKDETNHPFIKPITAFITLPLFDYLKDVNLSFKDILTTDLLLRETYFNDLKAFIELIHQFDLYSAVSETAREHKFCYAKALPAKENLLIIKNCRYPGLKNAIGNDIQLNEASNVLFLTGANMAGKSTFMKAFGITSYLAHMGFPVPADAMSFSVKEGLYSSINVSDNLALGYSHYYAEVMRVKDVALDVSQSKDLIVIFDELFKGTNVKDAYDATLAVTEGFAQNRNCFFIISTHIIEVGDALQQRIDNVRFAYLPTIMDGRIPRYTYQMQEGITSDKHGMMIIENEGIIEILK